MNAANATTENILFIQSMAQLTANYYQFSFLAGLGVLAMLTNPFIILTIWRQKSLHSGCFFLIAQLALADFFVGAAFAFTGVKRFTRIGFNLGEVIPQLQCTFEMTPNYFSESASLSLALAIGFERLSAAAYPLSFRVNEWKIARAASVVAWLIPAIDSCSMLIVMILSDTETIVFCTATSALTNEFEAVTQVVKCFVAVAIVLMNASVLLTIRSQLNAAKKRNQRSLAEMKKNLQLKMVRMVVAIATMYLVLQMAMRIGIIFTAKLPYSVQNFSASILRMFVELNSGIHLFVYIGASTEFRKAFVKTVGVKAVSNGSVSPMPIEPVRPVRGIADKKDEI